MKTLKFIAIVATVGAVAGTTWFYRRADGAEAPSYRTAALTRGSITSTVSATGTLQAVRTVQVGTQVSGQVAQIYADFNQKVKQGQLLARIDPTLQQQAVQDAQAQLEKAQAQLTQAQDEFTRSKALFDARVITASEFGTTQSTFAVQQASVKSAQIALDRARQNLSYTSIYAPIDGVIVERNVDVGQTVAASLSAPQLFLIANDLSEMQILASVDESDIGQIKEGQTVQFTVQSYPSKRFTGTVKQVRLQSTTTDNVVNYTAVIGVKNDEGNLLPGMTATVKFVTASADNVLSVPNAALRITPTAAMLEQSGEKAPVAHTGKAVLRPAASLLWVVDKAETVRAIHVQPGLSDGQKTEVTGDGITDGMQVVTSVANGQASVTPAGNTPAANPFQPTRPQGGGRGPGGL
ncbi:MAG TPA: efflux RND transporter periplasmic adaptor subunit [Gemmatimonadaceae bacterium]|nr:efflux RND transporter periplasmic adaptor subunit [Gemmatimonadaceae bacterium]